MTLKISLLGLVLIVLISIIRNHIKYKDIEEFEELYILLGGMSRKQAKEKLNELSNKLNELENEPDKNYKAIQSIMYRISYLKDRHKLWEYITSDDKLDKKLDELDELRRKHIKNKYGI